MKLTFTAIIYLLLMVSLAAGAETSGHYWVFFTDKAIPAGQESRALQAAEQQLTPRNRSRRLKSMAIPVDESDIPVSQSYLARVQMSGVKIRTVSKYLNAVSVDATPLQMERVRSLPFVQSAEPFRSTPIDLTMQPRYDRRRSLDDVHYGPSYLQNHICRIPELQTRGLTGQGVLICYLDSGFRLSHRVFDSLQVVATYDFIHGDSIVANQAGQDSAGQDGHGSAVLSAAAGYRDSILVGPAYHAQILCAKTEWVPTETVIEEDYYVAGLEWADSLGADITSSSLGYIDWYNFQDMNGHTAITTRGVQIAARHGILVVTASGNERASAWGHIVAPSDADSILSVGSVDTTRFISGFSSPGPTADGRIKPDVCALGEWVVSADVENSDGYFYLFGTSLATPIVSGTAALIMEAHPEWSAQQVRTAIKQTASAASNPNNDYGWGIVNGLNAADYIFDAVDLPRSPLPRASILLSSYPNPVNSTAVLTLQLPADGKGQLALYDLLGRQEYQWPQTQWTAGSQQVFLNTSDLPTGVHFVRFFSSEGHAVSRIAILK
jgi:subtilisin family serine protease